MIVDIGSLPQDDRRGVVTSSVKQVSWRCGPDRFAGTQVTKGGALDSPYTNPFYSTDKIMILFILQLLRHSKDRISVVIILF